VRIKLLCVVAVCVLMCGTAKAGPFTPFSCASFAAGTCGIAADWVGSTTDYRAGAVMFVDNGAFLDVYLTNASALELLGATYYVTGVFFDIDGNPTLSPLSATLFNSNGTSVTFAANGGDSWNASNDAETNVGVDDMDHEWAYARGTTQLRSGAGFTPGDGPKQGISSAGLGIFGVGNFGDSLPDLDNQNDSSVDGPPYGITTLGSTCVGCLAGNHEPLTQGVVKFHLSGFSGFNISDIGNVLFQYGTATNEPFTWPNCVETTDNPQQFTSLGAEVQAVGGDCGTNEVPEPASLILVGSGFLGLAGFLRRKLS